MIVLFNFTIMLRRSYLRHDRAHYFHITNIKQILMKTTTEHDSVGQNVGVYDRNSDTFSSRIDTLILQAGSVPEFARSCGVSDSVARKWRKGESDPSREHLVAISRAMKVNILWLATGEGLMRNPGGVTDKQNGYHVESQAQSNPDHDAYCYVPLYDVHASAGHGSLIDEEQVIDRLAFKKDWMKGEMGLNPQKCCLIHVTGDSMEPTLHKKDVVMLDCSHTIYREDGIYCLRLDGGLLVKRVQRINSSQVKIISDNAVYQPYILDLVDVQFIGLAVWIGKRL